MTERLLERYRMLLAQLLFEREAAGGDLPEEEESRFVAALDDVLRQLGPSVQAEIDRIDREVTQVPLQVAEDPHFVDLAVAEGTSVLPRKAA